MALLIWAVLLVIVALARVVHTYFFSPLSHIPNASLLAPLSRLLWEFPMEHRGFLTLELPKLHKKLGPLVRIGPSQVSFYSLDVYKTVHAPGSSFAKDPRVYDQFVQDGHPALFSITDAKEHAQRRRHMGLLFNRSKVPGLTPMMIEEISKFKTFLDVSRKEGSIDLVAACRALEADIVSRFAFGNAIGAIDSLMAGEELQIIKQNDMQSSRISLYTNFPFLVKVWELLATLVFRLTRRDLPSVYHTKRFDVWANEQLKATLDAENASSLSFLKVMARDRIPEQCALSEAKEMLGPGTDTTSSTLAHILWALSLNQSLQNDLISDLEAAGWPTDMTELESVPRLTACVKEGIRWAGAAAAMLPRIVPSRGSVLAGRHLPGGTMVSSSPIWYLRDENAFPDPETYRPSRWLTKDGDETNALRNEYYIPFSKGPGTCVGMHFAYLELYLSISQILKRYRVEAADGIQPGNLEVEATLPARREWVAAVPVGALRVCFSERVSLV